MKDYSFSFLHAGLIMHYPKHLHVHFILKCIVSSIIQTPSILCIQLRHWREENGDSKKNVLMAFKKKIKPEIHKQNANINIHIQQKIPMFALPNLIGQSTHLRKNT